MIHDRRSVLYYPNALSQGSGYLLFVLLLIFSLFFSCRAIASTVSESERTQALFLFDDGEYKQVISHLDLALADDATDKHARYYRGLAHSRLGNFNRAFSDLKTVYDRDLKADRLAFELGYVYYRLEKMPDAALMFAEATLHDSSDVESQYYLGLTRYRLGDYSAALIPLEVVASKAGRFAASNAYLRGDTLLKLERPDEAKIILLAGIESHPGSIYVNPSMELLIALGVESELKRLWQLQVSVGQSYDSNVGLFHNSDAIQSVIPGEGNLDDVRSQFALTFDWQAFERPREALKFGYRLFNSRHSDLDFFNVLSHIVTAEYQYKKQDNLLYGITYQYSQATLDGEDYLNSHLLVPNMIVSFGRHYGVVMLQWQQYDYQQISYQNRSGDDIQARYRHYWTGGKTSNLYLYLGGSLGVEIADSDAFSNTVYGFESGLQFSFNEWLVRPRVLYEFKEYKDAVPVRENERFEFGIKGSKYLKYGWALEPSVSYVENISTDRVYDYKRTQINVAAKWSW